jgi:stearoyl-CoA desaturase (delta-9 desaturase)
MQQIAKTGAPGLKVNLKNTLLVISFHLIALAAVYTFSWTNLAVMLVGNWVVGGLGVGLGYHRLLTHRSFVAPKWLEYTLTVFGTMSIQDGPVKWVATHRIHHQHTEVTGDPHSTREGFWWAHMFWILRGTAQDHDEGTLKRYVPDLVGDRFHTWLGKYFYLPLIISGVALFLIGGLPMVIWGVFVRVVFGWHTTWFVNSAAHFWGKRRFQTDDDSTNNWVVALLTFGEGWHNNHHARPSSARHGLKWYEFDLNWQTVRVFRLLGWADRVRLHDAKS